MRNFLVSLWREDPRFYTLILIAGIGLGVVSEFSGSVTSGWIGGVMFGIALCRLVAYVEPGSGDYKEGE